MDRKKIEKAEIDKEALNKILAPFSRSFLIKQIWDEEPSPGRRSTICVRFKKGNWTKLEIMRIRIMLSRLISSQKSFVYDYYNIIKDPIRNVGNYSKAIKELDASMCPKCNSKLLDTNPGIILTSMPPKKDVYCSKCSYAGYREV